MTAFMESGNQGGFLGEFQRAANGQERPLKSRLTGLKNGAIPA